MRTASRDRDVEVKFPIINRPTIGTIPKQHFAGKTTELPISQTTNAEESAQFSCRIICYPGYPDRNPIGTERRSKVKRGKVSRAGGTE